MVEIDLAQSRPRASTRHLRGSHARSARDSERSRATGTSSREYSVPKGKWSSLSSKGRAKSVPVQTGISNGEWIEIISGLQGDEEVVVVGKRQLVDGIPVRATPSPCRKRSRLNRRFERRSAGTGSIPVEHEQVDDGITIAHPRRGGMIMTSASVPIDACVSLTIRYARRDRVAGQLRHNPVTTRLPCQCKEASSRSNRRSKRASRTIRSCKRATRISKPMKPGPSKPVPSTIRKSMPTSIVRPAPVGSILAL